MNNEKLEILEKRVEDIYSLVADLNMTMDRMEALLRDEHKKDIVTMANPVYVEKPLEKVEDQPYENAFMKHMLKYADVVATQKTPHYKRPFVEHYKDESVLYSKAVKHIAQSLGKKRTSMAYLFSFLYLDFEPEVKYKIQDIDKMIMEQNNKMSKKNSGRVYGVYVTALASVFSDEDTKKFTKEVGVDNVSLGKNMRLLQERIIEKLENARKSLTSSTISLEPITVEKMIHNAAEKAGASFEKANDIREVVAKALMNNSNAFFRNPNFTTGFLMIEFENEKEYTEAEIGKMLKENYEKVFCQNNGNRYTPMRFASERVDTKTNFGLRGIYKRAIFAFLTPEEVFNLRTQYYGFGLTVSGFFNRKLQEKIREKLGLLEQAA